MTPCWVSMVTTPQPMEAINSAEKAPGMEHQPPMAGLPAAQSSRSRLARMLEPPFDMARRRAGGAVLKFHGRCEPSGLGKSRTRSLARRVAAGRRPVLELPRPEGKLAGMGF